LKEHGEVINRKKVKTSGKAMQDGGSPFWEGSRKHIIGILEKGVKKSKPGKK